MVIIRLRGGLGNQMFQYATGLALAQAKGAVYKLDLSFFQRASEGITPRRFALDKFQISAGIASPKEVYRHCGKTFTRRLSGLIPDRWKFPTSVLKEKHFHYDPTVRNASGDVYLDGYWQSEKYFSNIRDLLLKEFSLRTPPDGRTREVAQRIASCTAVSVHVRRGDYVSCAKTAAHHGSCPPEYYQECIATIQREVNAPEFFVFSDDLAWARENIRCDSPMHFVEHNGSDSPQEDLLLISFCNHHIISNSSFGWWGAWLSKHVDKKIYAPAQWFVDSKIDTSDLIPPAWIRL